MGFRAYLLGLVLCTIGGTIAGLAALFDQRWPYWVFFLLWFLIGGGMCWTALEAAYKKAASSSY